MRVKNLFAMINTSTIVIAIVPAVFILVTASVVDNYWGMALKIPGAQIVLFICLCLELLGLYLLRRLGKVKL